MVDGLVKDILDYFRVGMLRPTYSWGFVEPTSLVNQEDMKEVVELPALKNFVANRTDKVALQF